MKQHYQIAGLKVAMDSFGRTVDQARPYMVDAFAQADIELASDFSDVKARNPELSDEGCEYLSSGKNFYTQLLNYDGMMVHSSALILDGYAYLFTADCGTGKSTHVCLWRRVFGDDRVRVLNDDKPALRLEDGVWYAYGTPWSGKTGQNLNLRAPLAGIAVVHRAEKNSIEPFAGKEAVTAIVSQTTRVKNMALQLKQLELVDRLFKDVPIWKLNCNMDPEAAMVSYEAMRPKCD